MSEPKRQYTRQESQTSADQMGSLHGPNFTGLSLTDLFNLQTRLKERMEDLATQAEMAPQADSAAFATKRIQHFPLHDALKEELETRLSERGINIQ